MFQVPSSKFQESGFTLVELLIYIVIVAVVAGLIAQTLIFIAATQQKTEVRKIVDENLDFAFKKLEQSVKSASAANITNNTLSLTIAGITVTYSLSVDNILQKKIGAAEPVDITSDKVIVSPIDSVLFFKIENPGVKPTIQIKIKVKYNSQDPKLSSIESKAQTTVSLR